MSSSSIGTKVHRSMVLSISAVQFMSCGRLYTQVDSSWLLFISAMHFAPSVQCIGSKHAELAATFKRELPRGSVSTTGFRVPTLQQSSFAAV